MKHMTAVSKERLLANYRGIPAVADSSLLIKESRIGNWTAFVEAAADTLAFIMDLITFRAE